MISKRLSTLASLILIVSCAGGPSAQSTLPSSSAAVTKGKHLKHHALPPGAYPIVYIDGTGGNHVQSYSTAGSLLTDLTNTDAQNGTDIAVDPTTANLYVAQLLSETYIFAYGATGTTAPIASLDVPFGDWASSVTVDSSGYIWMGYNDGSGDPGNSHLSRYSPGSTGSTSPIQTINLGLHIAWISNIATDASGNIYAMGVNGSNIPTIVKYSSTASGSATPTKTISGSNTGIGSPLYGIAVDSAGRMVVADYPHSRIAIFNAGDNGNVAPDVVISGTNTLLFQPYGVEIGGSDDIYVTKPHNDTILVFASTASGNATPTNVISTSIAGGAITLCRSSDGCQSHI